MASPRDSLRGPPRRSGEKSVGTGKKPSVGGKRGKARSDDPPASRSKSSAPLSPDAQARHDALIAAKALM